MTSRPTRSASGDSRGWQPSPILAMVVRTAVFLAPLVGAFLIVDLVARHLYRPSGLFGLVLWFVQAAVIGSVMASLFDRLARRLLPLVALLKISLIFPDEAPSRFGVALRSGSLTRLQDRIDRAAADGLGASAAEAATNAVELISALGAHDRITRGHTERVRAYTDMIGRELGLSDEECNLLSWGALLHDIGKLTVPAEILNKETALTDDEWRVLAGHPDASRSMMGPLADWLGPWALAACEHHERWDGAGYPRELGGQQISLAGRIVAVADAYDVMTSKRSYKPAMPVAVARQELVDCAGRQFDPVVVRAFLNLSLGRRWLAGPLAVLSHLPVGQLGNAPVAVSIATLLSAGSVAILNPPTETVELLTFTADATIEIEDVPVPTTIPPISADTTQPTTAPATSDPVDDAAPTTTVPPSVATTAASSTEASPTSAVSTNTVAPTTTAAPTITTAAPTTTALTTTTTAATTTAAPTTTTTAPTTTTTAATTTTTAPPPPYYLKNPGTGDTTARLFKELSLSGPDDATQPNFDTDRDSVPGLGLEPTSNGFGESDLRRIQRFGIDLSGSTVSGSAQAIVYLATDNDLGGAPVTVRASLADCNWLYTSCSTTLGEASATTNVHVGAGFQAVTFDFGAVSHTLNPGRRLILRFITEGSEKVHLAFDSTANPSTARFTTD